MRVVKELERGRLTELVRALFDAGLFIEDIQLNRSDMLDVSVITDDDERGREVLAAIGWRIVD